MKKVLLYTLLALCSAVSFAQNKTITGTVFGEDGKEALYAANVIVKGTTNGVTTDFDGKFSIELDLSVPLVLQISYLGHETQEITVDENSSVLTITMKMAFIPGQEVVVSASRVSETIMESSVSIEKMSAREIKSAPSGDFYQSLATKKGVDMVTSSAGFKVINMRGFNTTSPFRMVQFIDGMDNQAPGLNFPVGNLVGANDLDLLNIEMINGAASAMYGPNAFQGVVSMNSKNPFDYPGISAQLKGGTRGYLDGQFRFAKTVDRKKRFAFKLAGSYMQVEDWEADDPEANLYGDIETEVDVSSIVRGKQFDPVDEDFTQEDLDDIIALNNWLDFFPVANPGKLDLQAPGYIEADIANYDTRSIKFNGGAYYKINDSLQVSYLGKFGMGTAIYQGTNRYSIDNIKFQQHKLELTGKNFSVKAYTTKENAGDSYDLVFTSVNLSKEGIAEYVAEYISEYFGTIDTLTDGFDTDKYDDERDLIRNIPGTNISIIDSAVKIAEAAASRQWITPGSALFDSLFNEITTDPDLQTGSKFVDESKFQHIEAQYNLTKIGNLNFRKYLDINAGATFRRYDPQSFGTIFEDTLANPSDTLPNGDHISDAEYVDISSYEFGGFIQASRKLWQNRIKLTASLRMDKNQNYDLQISPRGSIVYTINPKHVVRLSGQSAFRSPTLQNQYILLDLGPIRLMGNRNGYTNLYTWDSVESFLEGADTTFQYPVGDLEPIDLDPVKPEQVKTIEAGYRGMINNKLYIDLAGYYSVYTNFIGQIRVVRPDNGIAGEETGENDIIASVGPVKYYDLRQIPVNAKESVKSYGVMIGLSYSFGHGLTGNFNYTYADLNTKDLTDPVLPGFNTPNHKFNIGLLGRKVWKGLGFSANLKWVDSYYWESTFGDGPVPSFHQLDAQINYEIPKWFSTVRIGGSNIYNNKHKEAYGSPQIGSMFYAGWTFEFNDL